jgi:L-methionine (R)-S-oxide reductase
VPYSSVEDLIQRVGYYAIVSGPDKLQDWLQQILTNTGATSGTVHLHENDGLRLAASVNIPPPVQQIVAWVPNGKGMAGLALQRCEPVQTCNLQEDRSGNVKPGAKAVNAQAAVAIPVQNPTGYVRAVVGIAFQDERQFTSADLEELTRTVSTMPDAA